MVSHAVPDWSGGTRIGEALADFNKRLGASACSAKGAVVLLVTDGLDRDGAAGLAENMERLHKSCSPADLAQSAVALGPASNQESQGIRAMLPHVDEFRPVHNLASLRSLVESLSRPAQSRDMANRQWRLAS